MPNLEELAAILRACRDRIADSSAVFDWSSWLDQGSALSELDGHIESLEAGGLPSISSLTFLFLPTGPLQEVAISSGWGGEFNELADRFDVAIQ